MHYNIQVHIQQVQEGMTEGRGLAAPKREREVTSMLELKITASTEAEAYERALRVLSMNAPAPTLAEQDVLEEKLQRFRTASPL